MAPCASLRVHAPPAPETGSVRNSLRSDNGRFFIRFRHWRRVALDGDPQVKNNSNSNGNGNCRCAGKGKGNGNCNGNGNGNGNCRCAGNGNGNDNSNCRCAGPAGELLSEHEQT